MATERKSVDALGKVKIERGRGRDHKLKGKHSAMCLRQKHEDWQHGLDGCAVGTSKETHCDCTAHWVEVVPTRYGQ